MPTGHTRADFGGHLSPRARQGSKVRVRSTSLSMSSEGRSTGGAERVAAVGPAPAAPDEAAAGAVCGAAAGGQPRAAIGACRAASSAASMAACAACGEGGVGVAPGAPDGAGKALARGRRLAGRGGSGCSRQPPQPAVAVPGADAGMVSSTAPDESATTTRSAALLDASARAPGQRLMTQFMKAPSATSSSGDAAASNGKGNQKSDNRSSSPHAQQQQQPQQQAAAAARAAAAAAASASTTTLALHLKGSCHVVQVQVEALNKRAVLTPLDDSTTFLHADPLQHALPQFLSAREEVATDA